MKSLHVARFDENISRRASANLFTRNRLHLATVRLKKLNKHIGCDRSEVVLKSLGCYQASGALPIYLGRKRNAIGIEIVGRAHWVFNLHVDLHCKKGIVS